MAFVVADRVKETSTTTGTGTFTLAGAVTGFQSFAAIGNGNTTYYCIASQSANEWEVGYGTYTSSGTTLARNTVLSSSNGGSLVNFSAGTKDVFVTYPAGYSVYSDGTRASGTWGINISGNAATVSSITSGQVTGALGYTPYNSTNPAGYVTATGVSRIYDANGSGAYLSLSATNELEYFNSSGVLQPLYLQYSGGVNSLLGPGGNVILNAGNYNSYAVARGGDTVWNTFYFGSNKGASSYVGSNNTYGLEAYSSDGGAAAMSFHRGGYYAVNMGLDPDNVFRIGGWSASANRLQLDMSGNLYSASSMRTSIFYDQDNTGYYVDPASTDSGKFAGYLGLGGNSYSTNMSGTYGVSIYHASYPAVGWSNSAAPNYLIYKNGASLILWNSTNSDVMQWSPGPFTIAVGSMRSPIFYDSDNTGYYLDPTGGSNLNSVTVAGPYYRSAAGAGYLNGQYSSIETISTSGAIYSIGGSYVPGTTTLGNMYGIGYTYAGYAAGNPGGVPTNTWGMYVASAGVARVFLDSDNGRGYFASGVYATIFYDGNNTGYYLDPASGSNLNALNVQYINNNTWYYYNDNDRNANSATYYPNATARAFRYAFVSSSSTGTGGNYAGLLQFNPYDGTTASTGDASYQMAWGSTAANGGGVPQLRIRKGIDTTWNAWVDIITSANISSYASSAGAGGAMLLNTQTISANYTLTGNNAVSAGPITVNTGVTVTIATGCSWSVV